MVRQSGCIIPRLMLQLGFTAAVDKQKRASIRKIESSVSTAGKAIPMGGQDDKIWYLIVNNESAYIDY